MRRKKQQQNCHTLHVRQRFFFLVPRTNKRLNKTSRIFHNLYCCFLRRSPVDNTCHKFFFLSWNLFFRSWNFKQCSGGQFWLSLNDPSDGLQFCQVLKMFRTLLFYLLCQLKPRGTLFCGLVFGSKFK